MEPSLFLIIFQDRDQGAADRQARAVQRVDEARALAVRPGDSARSCAAPGNRRSWSRTKSRGSGPGPAARLRCRRSSAAEKPMSPVHSVTTRCGRSRRLSTSCAQSVMRSCSAFGLFRRGDGDQFHLGELVQADHAARVPPRRARLGAEARRVGGEAQRQLRLRREFPRAHNSSAALRRWG